MERLLLGAYQSIDAQSHDLGEQFTESGAKPRTLVIKLTTAMDVPFVNSTVTALLTEEDQRAIINLMQRNLNGEDL
jgi:hypothetical protein